MPVPRSNVRLLLLMALLAFTTALAAAQAKKKVPPRTDPPAKAVLGAWTTTVPNASGGDPGRITITFKKDGTLDQVIEGNGHKITLKAKYTLSGGWLTETLVKGEEDGKRVTLPDAGTKKLTIRVKDGTLYINAPDKGGTEMAFKRMKR